MDENTGVTQDLANLESPNAEQKISDKEVNLANLRRAKEQIEYQLELKNLENQQLLQQLESIKNSRSQVLDEEEEDEIVDLEKELKRVRKELKKTQKEIDKRAEDASRRTYQQEQERNFMTRLKMEFPDFDQVVNTETANKLQQHDADLAKDILDEKDEYKRRKRAYLNIRALGLHKTKSQPIQEKIDSNRKSLYYVPESIGSGTVAMQDFSEAGKKASWEKMRALMKRPIGS